VPAPRDPLEPLATVRKLEVEERAESLLGATASRELAELKRRQLALELEAQRAALETAMAESARELRDGGLRAAELSQAEAFRSREEAGIAARARRLVEVDQAVASAREEEERARAALGQARAEETVLDRHRARLAREERRAAEGRAEEAQAEAHAAARRPRPRGPGS